jgi:hypothetical protein
VEVKKTLSVIQKEEMKMNAVMVVIAIMLIVLATYVALKASDKEDER